MKKSAKIPRILKINAVKDWQVFVTFNNGAQRVIDFAAFFQQHHFATDPLRARLLDPAVFQQLELHEGTLRWPQLLQRIGLGEGLTFEVPFDLDPIVLYDFSVLDPTRSSSVAIGVLLRTARKDAGMTQAELAKRSGTTKHYISRIENDHADIELGTLLKIVEVGLGRHLEVSVR